MAASARNRAARLMEQSLQATLGLDFRDLEQRANTLGVGESQLWPLVMKYGAVVAQVITLRHQGTADADIAAAFPGVPAVAMAEVIGALFPAPPA